MRYTDPRHPSRRAAPDVGATLGRGMLLLLVSTCPACGRAPGVHGAVGPVLGHVDSRRAFVWYRPAQPGTYTLDIRRADGEGPTLRIAGESRPAADGTIVWQAGGLQPATPYRYAVRGDEGVVLEEGSVRTAPAPGAAARVTLAFGSCASLEDHPVWSRMGEAGTDALVLLGDTPYIDSTQLATARLTHRRFLALPALAASVRDIPLWSTWDDHDYGQDNGDGSLAGKAATRKAYVEYRAQARYGENGEGIYTSVRYGPIEVFLLDGRWFAGLEPAATDPAARSCLGHRQWRWLLDGLRSSDAPFKVLASGMVWHDKGGRSQDDWATYAAERDGLFAFLGEARVTGCVLLGGDVHACQHAVHENTLAGYPLHELVVSPLHARTWRGGDRRHPARRWGAVEPHVFLLLEADTTAPESILTARWKCADGRELHAVRLLARDLRR